MDFDSFLLRCREAALSELRETVSSKLTVDSDMVFSLRSDLLSESTHSYCIDNPDLSSLFVKAKDWQTFTGSQMCFVKLNIFDGLWLPAIVDKDQRRTSLDFEFSLGPNICDFEITPAQDFILENVCSWIDGWIGDRNSEENHDGSPSMDSRYHQIKRTYEFYKKQLGTQHELSSSNDIADLITNDYYFNFLWGPPGAGKTHNTSTLISESINAGKTCGVFSVSNQAVDNILLKYIQLHPEQVKEGRVLREGNPLSKNRKQLHLTLAKSVFRELLEEEYEQLEELYRKQSEVENDGTRIELIREIGRLKEKIYHKKANAILSNRITIFTTVAQTFSNSLFSRLSFDNIFVDEASMLPGMLLFFLTPLATKKAVFVGDPKQLEPVVKSASYVSKEMLMIDPFALFKIKETRRLPPYVHYLGTTYRIPKNITKVISDIFYDGNLVSHNEITDGKNINLVDLGNDGIESEVDNEGHSCDASADWIVQFCKANKYSSEEVLIITPTRKQKKVITSLFLNQNMVDLARRVFTVHAVQGGEAEIVFFDTAHYGNVHVSRLLRKEKNEFDSSDRLLNVAISRTKRDLYVLYDQSFVSNNRMMISGLYNLLKGLKREAKKIAG